MLSIFKSFNFYGCCESIQHLIVLWTMWIGSAFLILGNWLHICMILSICYYQVFFHLFLNLRNVNALYVCVSVYMWQWVYVCTSTTIHVYKFHFLILFTWICVGMEAYNIDNCVNTYFNLHLNKPSLFIKTSLFGVSWVLPKDLI